MKNEKRKKATIIKEKKRIRKEGPLWEIERLRNCPRLCSGNAGLIVGTAQAPQLEEHQGEGEAGQRHRQQCAARLCQWAQGRLGSASNAGRLPSRPSTSAAARIRGSGPIRHRSMIAPPANRRRATRTGCKREVLATRWRRGKQSSMPAGRTR